MMFSMNYDNDQVLLHSKANPLVHLLTLIDVKKKKKKKNVVLSLLQNA